MLTAPVARFRPNDWGLFDMHGNVWEWCSNWSSNYQGGSFKDPKGPQNGQYRVLRGGSLHYTPPTCRSAYRNSAVPDGRYYDAGFRVVLRVQP